MLHYSNTLLHAVGTVAADSAALTVGVFDFIRDIELACLVIVLGTYIGEAVHT